MPAEPPPHHDHREAGIAVMHHAVDQVAKRRNLLRSEATPEPEHYPGQNGNRILDYWDHFLCLQIPSMPTPMSIQSTKNTERPYGDSSTGFTSTEMVGKLVSSLNTLAQM